MVCVHRIPLATDSPEDMATFVRKMNVLLKWAGIPEKTYEEIVAL